MLSLATIVGIETHHQQLKYFQAQNRVREMYYTGKIPLKSLDISLPKSLENMKLACAFPGIVVDTLEERINFQGYYADDSFGLTEIFLENNLEAKSSMVHIDTLQYGTGYIIVGRGNQDEGEPEILITPESPNHVFGKRNLRTGRLDSAIQVAYTGNKQEAIGTFFTKTETIPFAISESGDIYEDGDLNAHLLGKVPVLQFVNRPQTSNTRGRSEIDETVMRTTDSAIRTSAMMEANRELYGNPQTVFSNVNPAEFMDEDGNPRNPFSVRANEGIILGAGDPGAGGSNYAGTAGTSGGSPTITQLTVGSPEPMLAMLRKYAEDIASHSHIPINQFGISTANPPSAEAIAAQENGLVKKAERRIANIRRVWDEAGRLAVEIRDGEAPAFSSVSSVFSDPSTPTRNATADEMVKYVGLGTIDAKSDFVLSRMNLSTQEREMILRDWASAKVTTLVENLALAAQNATPVSTTPAV
jgi:hypothetical protein